MSSDNPFAGLNSDVAILDLLFTKLEPLFCGVVDKVTMNISLADSAYYRGLITDAKQNSKKDFNNLFMSRFRDRINQGFAKSFNQLTQEKENTAVFVETVSAEMKKFEYSKEVLKSIFGALKYEMKGTDNNVDTFLEEKWNSNYLVELNTNFDLVNSISKLISDDRMHDDYFETKTKIVQFVSNVNNNTDPKDVFNILKDKSKNVNLDGIKKIIEMYESVLTEQEDQLSIYQQICSAIVENSERDYLTLYNTFREKDIVWFLECTKKFYDKEKPKIDSYVNSDELKVTIKEKMEHIFITNTVDEVLANYKTVFYSKSNLALSCIQMCFLTNEIVTKQFLDKTEELFLKKCTDHINEALTTNLDILNNSDAISNLLLKLYESMEDLIVNGFLSDWRFKKVLNETLKNILMNNELLNLVGDD
ncbi:hypothetical protein EIN_493980, partial [Entamoeba invadens IP1]